MWVMILFNSTPFLFSTWCGGGDRMISFSYIWFRCLISLNKWWKFFFYFHHVFVDSSLSTTNLWFNCFIHFNLFYLYFCNQVLKLKFDLMLHSRIDSSNNLCPYCWTFSYVVTFWMCILGLHIDWERRRLKRVLERKPSPGLVFHYFSKYFEHAATCSRT